MTAQTRTVDIGGPVHLDELPGPDGAETIVLVHGLGASKLSWRPLAELLATTHRVLVPDLVGFGHTEPLGRSSSVQANRDLLLDLIRREVDGPAIVVGNSMGGMIGALAAAHSPGQVRALVLLDPAIPGTVAPGALRSVDWRVPLFFLAYNLPWVGTKVLELRRRRLGPEEQVDVLLRMVCTDPSRVPADVRAELVALARLRREHAWSDAAFLQAQRSLMRLLTFRRREYLQLLNDLEPPTLLVHGADDRLVSPAAARAIAAANPHLDFRELDGVGHAPQLEVPELTAEVVRGWLARRVDQATSPPQTSDG